MAYFYISSKFQVSAFGRFKVMAFLTSGSQIRNFTPKKTEAAEVSMKENRSGFTRFYIFLVFDDATADAKKCVFLT